MDFWIALIGVMLRGAAITGSHQAPQDDSFICFPLLRELGY